MASLLAPNEILSLSRDAATRLLERGDGDCALLYLALLSGGGEGERARRSLAWDPVRFSAAADRLAQMGLIQPEQLAPAPPPPVERTEEPPVYAKADLTAALQREPDFRGLVNSVESALGRPLSEADLRSLYTIYDFIALPPEVILLLANWCVSEAELTLGPGRRPRMSDIKKMAFRWKRQGVESFERAEAFIRRQEQFHGRERDLMALMDLGDRVPVEKEREYLSTWVEMGFSDDAIRLAYERTILRKQRLHWSYMNSILKRWDAAGLHTAAQVEAGDRPQGGKDTGSGQAERRTGSKLPTAMDYQPSAERVRENDRWMREYLASLPPEEREPF